MRPGEATALEETKTKVKELHSTAFSLMETYIGMSPEELIQSGQRNKTMDQILSGVVTDTIAKKNRLWKEFLKKFPD